MINGNLFASIDMGTNSFKLLIVQAHPSGRFFPLLTLKEPVVLGRDSPSFTISARSQLVSLQSLQKFKDLILTHRVPLPHTRCVATAAVREAQNRAQFVQSVNEAIGLQVDVLPGEQEARFAYLGVLQFLPVYNKLVLTVDIGGGSTEFAIGKRGEVLYCFSLKVGHVTLTQRFANDDESEAERVLKMRGFVRDVIRESGLVDKVKEFGFELAVGCSGTIRAIEKAIFYGYGRGFLDNEALFRECKRDWRFDKGELRNVIERLYSGGEGEKIRRDGFFKRRSEFIVAGTVLLEEIFELLGIEEMEVSGYGLGEGVIAETLAKAVDGYDLNANARWRSVLRLANRFSGKQKINAAAQCAGIAKEIFEGLRRCNELADDEFKLMVSLDDKDLEYLEAACLLHSIGLVSGKRGYHKQSCHIIMNGDHLHGYSAEEVKLIALLTRHHRKKFPMFDHASFKEFPDEVKEKFRVFCAIIRISVVLQRSGCIKYKDMEFSRCQEGFKLVIQEARDRTLLQPAGGDVGAELRLELDYFKTVFKQELLLECHDSLQKRPKDETSDEGAVSHS